MDEQIRELTRQVGELAATVRQQNALLKQMTDVAKEQSGAMAVVSAEALANRREVEELKKKAMSKPSKSSYWQQRFDDLKAKEKEIGRRPIRLSSSNWTRPS